LQLIPIKEISFFSADQKYVCVHHGNGQNLIDDSLKSLEQEFADSFVRIHRAALVAVDQIGKLEKLSTGKTRVVLRSGSQQDDNDLIISRRHLADVRRRLKGG
jgi:two-component system response regulator AlgR